MNSTSYRLSLPQFDGPFDLILYFIERDELDIHNIPIAQITEDFLAYIKEMQNLNIELASEFILVAASLMRIKAKMLIPRKEVDEEGNEIDPRKELVERLLEYKRYKETMDEFRNKEEMRSMKHIRGYTNDEVLMIANKFSTEAELNSLTLYKLMQAFERVMERFEEEQNKPIHTVVQYDFTLEGQKEFLTNMVKGKVKVPFENIFNDCTTRIHALFNYLSLLELIQLQVISIQVGEGFNNFWISDAELKPSTVPENIEE